MSDTVDSSLMPAETAESRTLRELASDAAQALAAFDDVLAVCLVGSAARGDAAEDSDVDLVVIAEQRLLRADVLTRLPRDLRDERLSLLCFSRAGWGTEVSSGSLFVHHVRLEGRPLIDREGLLREGFETAARQKPNVEAELRRQVNRLRLYRKPERLNGEHLFALSHLYAIGKAVAIARCIELDAPIFVKEKALARLAEIRPDLADEASAVSDLRPFYDLTRERDVEDLPFAPVDAEAQILRARAAIERLAFG
jgi:predicted nucleotidyltransferase